VTISVSPSRSRRNEPVSTAGRKPPPTACTLTASTSVRSPTRPRSNCTSWPRASALYELGGTMRDVWCTKNRLLRPSACGSVSIIKPNPLRLTQLSTLPRLSRTAEGQCRPRDGVQRSMQWSLFPFRTKICVDTQEKQQATRSDARQSTN
jgi:hypothetical protein